MSETGPQAAPTVPASLVQLRALVAYAYDEIKPNLRSDDDAERLIFIAGMFSRATTTVEAITVLVEQGFGQQAWMLSRAVIELMIDSRWADQDRDLATQRILEYHQWERHRRRREMAKNPELLGAPPAGEELSDDLAALLSGRFAGGSWTGRTYRQRISDVTRGMKGHDADQLRTLTTFFNDLGNEELHPSPVSIARVIRKSPLEDGRFMFQMAIAREDYLSDGAVRATWWAYLMVLELVVDIFDLDRDKLRSLFDTGSAALSADDGA